MAAGLERGAAAVVSPAVAPTLAPTPKPVPAAALAPAATAPPVTAQKAAVAPVPKAAPAASASGGAAVQIGAFSSQSLADKGWIDAAKLAPGMTAGKGKSSQAVEVSGKTLYRTAVTGFKSKEDAEAFCSALKAAGKSCFTR